MGSEQGDTNRTDHSNQTIRHTHLIFLRSMEIHVLGHFAIHTEKRTDNQFQVITGSLFDHQSCKASRWEKISLQSWVRKRCFKLKSVYFKHKGNTNYIKSENLYFWKDSWKMEEYITQWQNAFVTSKGSFCSMYWRTRNEQGTRDKACMMLLEGIVLESYESINL